MKILIASDIHGSALYCRQLLDAWDREKPEEVVLLGDILYHGPRNDLPEAYDPKSVLALLNERRDRILCVRGNCDTEVDQMVLTFPILSEYAWMLLPGNRRIFATHGHIWHPDHLPPLAAGTSCCTGIRMSPHGKCAEASGASIRDPFPFPRGTVRGAI